MKNLIEALKNEVDQLQSATLPPILAPVVALLVDLYTAHLAHESRITALESELATAKAALETAAAKASAPAQPVAVATPAKAA